MTAQAVGAGTGLYLLYKKKGGLFRKVPSEHKFFSFDKKCIYEIYTTGIPAALETVFWQVSAIILSKVIFMNKKELAMPELKQSYKFLSLELHINN